MLQWLYIDSEWRSGGETILGACLIEIVVYRGASGDTVTIAC